MNIIQECVILAKEFEGLHKRGKDNLIYAYHDPVGYPTIGWGNLLSMEKYGDLSKYPPKTIGECELDLIAELEKKKSIAIKLSPILSKDENAYRLIAITDFIFNLGEGNYQKSTLKKMVDIENWGLAQIEILRWDKADGKPLAGLTKRRKKEAELLAKEFADV